MGDVVETVPACVPVRVSGRHREGDRPSRGRRAGKTDGAGAAAEIVNPVVLVIFDTARVTGAAPPLDVIVRAVRNACLTGGEAGRRQGDRLQIGQGDDVVAV